MHSEGIPGLQVKHDLALFSLLMLLFIVAVLGYVGLRMWRSLRSSASSRPVALNSGVHAAQSLSSLTQLACESIWLAVPFVVVASFGMMTAPHALTSGGNHLTTAGTQRVTPSTPPSIDVNSDAIPVSNVSTNDTPTQPAAARPAWLDESREVEGDCERIVLTSQQYSTQAEAEVELRLAAVQLVEQDLKRFQVGMFRPRDWRPSADDVIAHAVQQRYDDVTNRDFGRFSHPMHRVSWQIELSPRVRTEFAPAWRRVQISFRIMCLAGVTSLFAMLASASVMYFRLAALTKGRSHGWPKYFALGATATWFTIVASAFSQGHLW